jgi:sulfate transport system ATP-binding protein
MNRGRVEQAGTPAEVFDHPANAFVMDFLGNVNVFHGRVESGRAVLAPFDVAYPDYAHGESKAATVYVRPHELEIDRVPRGRSALKAEILRINPARSAVKVELLSKDFGMAVTVELAQERYAELQIKTGETVYVFPKRVRVFVQSDYQI